MNDAYRISWLHFYLRWTYRKTHCIQSLIFISWNMSKFHELVKLIWIIYLSMMNGHVAVMAESFWALHWRHNEPDGISNHQPRHCLLNCLFRCRSKKTSKLRVTGLWAENLPGTSEFSAQKASNAENVSIWWRHNGNAILQSIKLEKVEGTSMKYDSTTYLIYNRAHWEENEWKNVDSIYRNK